MFPTVKTCCNPPVVPVGPATPVAPVGPIGPVAPTKFDAIVVTILDKVLSLISKVNECVPLVACAYI